MVIGLKNGLGLIPDTVGLYDFAVNEACFTYNECSSYAEFTKSNKAVFSHIYKSAEQSSTKICSDAANNKLVTQWCPSINGDLCDSAWTHCSVALDGQLGQESTEKVIL